MNHLKRVLAGLAVFVVGMIFVVIFVQGLKWVSGGSNEVARRLCVFILFPILSIVLPIMLYNLGKDLVG